MRVTFDCEFATRPAQLVFDFLAHEEGAVRCDIKVSGPEASFTIPCFFEGGELSDFVKQLIGLDEQTRSEARLLSFDNHVDIRFIRHPKLDQVSVAGHVKHPAPFTGYDTGYVPIREGLEIISEAVEPHTDHFEAGINATFGGFVLDTSNLPRTLRWMSKFIHDAGISVENPWLRASKRS